MSAESPQEKERRKRFFRDLKQSLGVKSLLKVAERVDVSVSTLKQISSGRADASEKVQNAIRARAPSLDLTAISRPKEKEKSGLSNVLREMQDYILDSVKLYQDPELMQKQIRNYFENIGAGDIFCLYVCDEEPEEVKPLAVELRRLIAEAVVDRGAKLVYISSTNPEYAQTSESKGLNFDKIVEGLRKRIITEKKYGADDKAKLERGVFHIGLLHSPFHTPGIKHALFVSKNIKGKFAAVIGFHGYHPDGTAKSYVMLPLSREQGERMTTLIYEELDDPRYKGRFSEFRADILEIINSQDE